MRRRRCTGVAGSRPCRRRGVGADDGPATPVLAHSPAPEPSRARRCRRRWRGAAAAGYLRRRLPPVPPARCLRRVLTLLRDAGGVGSDFMTLRGFESHTARRAETRRSAADSRTGRQHGTVELVSKSTSNPRASFAHVEPPFSWMLCTTPVGVTSSSPRDLSPVLRRAVNPSNLTVSEAPFSTAPVTLTPPSSAWFPPQRWSARHCRLTPDLMTTSCPPAKRATATATDERTHAAAGALCRQACWRPPSLPAPSACARPTTRNRLALTDAKCYAPRPPGRHTGPPPAARPSAPAEAAATAAMADAAQNLTQHLFGSCERGRRARSARRADEWARHPLRYVEVRFNSSRRRRPAAPRTPVGTLSSLAGLGRLSRRRRAADRRACFVDPHFFAPIRSMKHAHGHGLGGKEQGEEEER